MFSGILQKDLFKGEWSSAETFFKQNIVTLVTLVTQGLPPSFLSSPVAVSYTHLTLPTSDLV